VTDVAWLKIHSSFDDFTAGSVTGPVELTTRVQAIIDMGYASVLTLETEPVASPRRTRKGASGGQTGTEPDAGEAGADAGSPAAGETDH
jgi:hypothetical protein